MKEIQLANKVYIRILKGQCELYERDLVSSIKGITPGEWVYFVGEKGNYFLGYLNPFATNGILGRVLSACDRSTDFDTKSYLQQKITNAVKLRFKFSDLKNGCRLIHGQADNLTGVICDLYKNCALLQINTAGMNIHRHTIKKAISELVDSPVYFLDNERYRSAEVLPSSESDSELPKFIDISEGGFSYRLDSGSIQKIGYYYDHRDNRKKLENYILRLSQRPKRGVDLFSYVGSWGLHMLRAGVEFIDFVDQGNFEQTVGENLVLNHFDANRGRFNRSDVFQFLDQSIKNNVTYDVVVSDPPAFKKKDQNKGKALGGYKKLHTKALQLVSSEGLFVAASCTSNISLDELDRTVNEASVVTNRKVRLVDVGVQGADHPIRSFDDKGNYIKYILYIVE